MSDDLRDYCECDECRKARLQLHLHSERKRKEREAVEALAVRFKLLPSTPSDETCGTCGGNTGFVNNCGTLDVCDDPFHSRANKNPHCLGDGVACAPDGAGACVACDDGRGYCTPKESQP